MRHFGHLGVCKACRAANSKSRSVQGLAKPHFHDHRTTDIHTATNRKQDRYQRKPKCDGHLTSSIRKKTDNSGTDSGAIPRLHDGHIPLFGLTAYGKPLVAIPQNMPSLRFLLK